MRNLILPIVLAILSTLSFMHAAQADSQFSISPSLIYFDYTEFDFNNSVLDTETGLVPGIQLQLMQDFSNQLRLELEISAYSGDVDYEGHTQTGLPHNTKTTEDLIRLGAHIIVPLFSNTEIYLASKYHQWDRMIHSNNGVSSLFEQYQWWEISTGTRISFWLRGKQSWIADIAILRTIKPTIYVDLSAINAGSANLDLGSDTGARLQLMWKISNDEKYTYSINTFYEIWDFGISDSKTTSGGTSSFSIFEPRSETRHLGLQFRLDFKY